MNDFAPLRNPFYLKRPRPRYEDGKFILEDEELGYRREMEVESMLDLASDLIGCLRVYRGVLRD